jgi:hypothetical protein
MAPRDATGAAGGGGWGPTWPVAEEERIGAGTREALHTSEVAAVGCEDGRGAGWVARGAPLAVGRGRTARSGSDGPGGPPPRCRRHPDNAFRLSFS